MHGQQFFRSLVLVIITIALNSCAPAPAPGGTVEPPTSKLEPASRVAPTPAPTLQPTATAADFGPDQSEFPAGINPLSGQPVTDSTLLKIPAMLVSISHFPVEARPQAGLSFTPFVF